MKSEMGGQPQAGAAKSDSALTVESLEPRLAGAEACLPQGRQLLDGEPPVADASTWRPTVYLGRTICGNASASIAACPAANRE